MKNDEKVRICNLFYGMGAFGGDCAEGVCLILRV